MRFAPQKDVQCLGIISETYGSLQCLGDIIVLGHSFQVYVQNLDLVFQRL